MNFTPNPIVARAIEKDICGAIDRKTFLATAWALEVGKDYETNKNKLLKFLHKHSSPFSLERDRERYVCDKPHLREKAKFEMEKRSNQVSLALGLEKTATATVKASDGVSLVPTVHDTIEKPSVEAFHSRIESVKRGEV